LGSPLSRFQQLIARVNAEEDTQEVEGVVAVSPAGRRRVSIHPETGTPSRRMKNPIEVRWGSRRILMTIKTTIGIKNNSGENGKPGVINAGAVAEGRRSTKTAPTVKATNTMVGTMK
jgi:hypothetical protein